MEDVNELLFKSWETFVQNTVQVAGYNKTVVCTIINDAEAIDGKFLVSDGATKFYAFTNSDPNLYKVDDTVYVLIPNGDYNKDKIILGRTTGDLEKPVNYVAPFDKYFDMTGNLLSDYYSNEYGLLANDDRANGSEICIAENIPVSVDDGNSFTRLGIKANFKSLTSTAITGNYGDFFDITVVGKNADTFAIATGTLFVDLKVNSLLTVKFQSTDSVRAIR